jgi:hypothetical protein
MEQVPIECLQVSYIKDNAMAFRDGPIVERFRLNDLEDLVRLHPGFGKTLE